MDCATGSNMCVYVSVCMHMCMKQNWKSGGKIINMFLLEI